ncbi:hypothetical protein LOK49_LG05G02090 [Camellia lanceoleosa]|uniref:Uncharacterized protein n=1 Tax=Camellia lanceoleosa TaxID=1840588 RepID=A0ACC0HRY0_9ERIC|nr:hypothetical protein LOK49_LG05G02090 [Camellia lanceoleosa]
MREGLLYCNKVKTSCDNNGGCCRNSKDGKEEDDEMGVELVGEVANEAVLAPVGRGSSINEVEGKIQHIADITFSRVIEIGSGLGVGGAGGTCMEMERRLSEIQIQFDNEGSQQGVGPVAKTEICS